jgi:glycosyltransferase involved in cell wall biosynthesis
MPVCINCRFLTQKVTGVQRYAIEISKKLKSLEPELQFVCPRNVIHTGLAEELQAVRIGKLTGHLWEQIDLPRYLKRNGRPILLNLANTAPLSYDRNVVTIHDLAVFRNSQWFSFGFRTLYRFMTPIIARKALKVLTVSEFSKSEIIDILKIQPERIDVIANAVAHNISVPAQDTFPNRYGRYILAVSSLDPRKNFSTLLDAFSQLPQTDLKLVMVGSESKVFADPDLKRKASSLKNIVFTGYLGDQDLAGLYQHAICLVYPSIYEGFGLPPIEAMACGCPVIVSDIPVLRETCGQAAIYCNPNDPADIAGQIIRVLNDEKLSVDLRSQGFEQIRQFSWETSARRLIEIIHTINPS